MNAACIADFVRWQNFTHFPFTSLKSRQIITMDFSSYRPTFYFGNCARIIYSFCSLNISNVISHTKLIEIIIKNILFLCLKFLKLQMRDDAATSSTCIIQISFQLFFSWRCIFVFCFIFLQICLFIYRVFSGFLMKQGFRMNKTNEIKRGKMQIATGIFFSSLFFKRLFLFTKVGKCNFISLLCGFLLLFLDVSSDIRNESGKLDRNFH